MKLRILHITPDFNYVDGRSYYASLLMKYLKKRGHFVHLATNSGDSLERIGSNFSLIPQLSSKYSFVSSVNRLNEIVKKMDINIIHSYHRYYELMANTVSGKQLKTVSTALSIVDKRFFVDYKSDKIIAVSNAVKQMLLRKFRVSENKIELIPNFADSGEIHNSVNNFDEPVKKENVFTILSAGRFDKEKDQFTLLKAMKLLKDKNVRLLLVGDGAEEKVLKNYAASNGLNIEFFHTKKNLNSFYGAADMCILTSVRDPLPTFMLQSGLHRKPFAGAVTDGIPEVIVHGVTGFLFPQKDERAVAKAIGICMSSKEVSAAVSNELHKVVMNDYTEKSVIPRIEKLYHSLIS